MSRKTAAPAPCRCPPRRRSSPPAVPRRWRSHGDLGRALGERLDRLVDGHVLLAVDDPLDRRHSASCPVTGLRRVDPGRSSARSRRPRRRRGGIDAGQAALAHRGDRLSISTLGVLGQPSAARTPQPLDPRRRTPLEPSSNSAASSSFGRPVDLMIGPRAASSASFSASASPCCSPDLDAVERDVVVEVRVEDEPVVADHRISASFARSARPPSRGRVDGSSTRTSTPSVTAASTCCCCLVGSCSRSGSRSRSRAQLRDLGLEQRACPGTRNEPSASPATGTIVRRRLRAAVVVIVAAARARARALRRVRQRQQQRRTALASLHHGVLLCGVSLHSSLPLSRAVFWCCRFVSSLTPPAGHQRRRP